VDLVLLLGGGDSKDPRDTSEETLLLLSSTTSSSASTSRSVLSPDHVLTFLGLGVAGVVVAAASVVLSSTFFSSAISFAMGAGGATSSTVSVATGAALILSPVSLVMASGSAGVVVVGSTTDVGTTGLSAGTAGAYEKVVRSGRVSFFDGFFWKQRHDCLGLLTWVSVVFSATTGVSSAALMSWTGVTVVSVVDIVME